MQQQIQHCDAALVVDGKAGPQQRGVADRRVDVKQAMLVQPHGARGGGQHLGQTGQIKQRVALHARVGAAHGRALAIGEVAQRAEVENASGIGHDCHAAGEGLLVDLLLQDRVNGRPVLGRVRRGAERQPGSHGRVCGGSWGERCDLGTGCCCCCCCCSGCNNDNSSSSGQKKLGTTKRHGGTLLHWLLATCTHREMKNLTARHDFADFSLFHFIFKKPITLSFHLKMFLNWIFERSVTGALLQL